MTPTPEQNSKPVSSTVSAWGVLNRKSEKSIDGAREYLMGRYIGWDVPDVPRHVAGFNMLAFKTRRECREFIKEKWGYIRDRQDLRAAPHGWLMPQPVRIKITTVAVDDQ